VHVVDAVHVDLNGRRYVNFASNNYLGLTHHPAIMAAATEATQDAGAGSGAAALISGYTDRHASAERTFASWKGTESSVLLPSGYQANHAVVQALVTTAEAAGRRVRFLLDKLVHASLVDAVRGSGAAFRVFPHNHLGKLARLLGEAEAGEIQVVVTESIFSMDGDAADLEGLAELKAKQPFLLVVDEAHGSGVYGPNGSGYAAERGVDASVDAFVVTLSKALGGAGGVICASGRFCEAVVNFGRAYVYSTNVPPAVAAAGEAAVGVLAREPHRQARVRELARRVRSALADADYRLPPGDSPIIPLLLGQEREALAAAGRLREAGLLLTAVRPPTVPRGTSRLRLTLSSEHTDSEVGHLVNELTRHG
jgi:8-amino-7-oxononanoate synthase